MAKYTIIPEWDSLPATLTSSDILVLLRLIHHADDDGVSWPSLRTLSRATRLNEKTIRRALERLIAHQVIRIAKRSAYEGRHRYQLAIEPVALPRRKKRPKNANLRPMSGHGDRGPGMVSQGPDTVSQCPDTTPGHNAYSNADKNARRGGGMPEHAATALRRLGF